MSSLNLPSDFPKRSSINTLSRFARRSSKSPVSTSPETTACELCSLPIPHTHRHLLEMERRRITCCCDPCALRFQDVINGRFKLIPREIYSLPDFRLGDELWASFALPIKLVFFARNGSEEKVGAYYPSPAGPTASLLPLESWETLVEDNPLLTEMEADVAALLVNRVNPKPLYFIAPIDRCYQLVGLLRVHWRGLSGGEVVWEKIGSFFDLLNREARPLVYQPKVEVIRAGP
jgi:Family of unknown function (DUF5947)